MKKKIVTLPRFIKTELGMYWRAVETKDFVYYCNYQEGDETANVIMRRKKNFELVSNNFLASNDLLEVIEEKTYTYLSPTMKKNIKLMEESES